jgi:transposase
MAVGSHLVPEQALIWRVVLEDREAIVEIEPNPSERISIARRLRDRHVAAGARALIEARGAILLYLPPYSPDLNPIEMAFAKLKALLRKAAARTRDSLWDAIADVISAFTPDECANYLAHAGYAST